MRKLDRPETRDHGPRVIAVASGKGGVGKSNFCVNFALGLMQAGLRPIVVDADLGFANVEVLLGARPKYSLYDVVEGMDILSAVQVSSSGLPFLSGGNGVFDIHSLSEEQVARLLQEMRKLQDAFDVLLLDAGSGLGANLGRLLSAADELILVTTPEPTAITDAYALLKSLSAHGHVPHTRIVVNRATQFTEGRQAAEKVRLVAERFLSLRIDVLGFILEDPHVPQAVRKQEAFLRSFPTSPAARCVRQLVHNYLRLDTAEPPQGFVGFIERVFRRFMPGQRDETQRR
ncbi:MinD/ParA family protein [Alicyclobacillus cellulosilyticus]|nr:MinD/ParA family protein [Alicyclobacillus cellulosilyticus]